jgi:hypothetical protein
MKTGGLWLFFYDLSATSPLTFQAYDNKTSIYVRTASRIVSLSVRRRIIMEHDIT